jgi:hypothetical protein
MSRDPEIPISREAALEDVERAAYAIYSVICVGGLLTLDSPEVKQYEAASAVLWKQELDAATAPSSAEAIAAARDYMVRLGLTPPLDDPGSPVQTGGEG